MNIIGRALKLNLPPRQFIVCGSGILEVKGIRQAKDLDILVEKDLFLKLKEDSFWTYTEKTGKFGDKIDILKNGDTEVFFHFYNKYTYDYFMNEPSRLEIVDGICFVSLSALRVCKED